MTANQIANAANQINQQQVDENQRHNKAAEEENARHNSILEELQSRSLDLQHERDYWDAWYKQESVALQKEYNNKYLEWQQSQGDRKLQIEQELAWIEQQKANADERYKWEITRIQKSANDIQADKVAEDKRSHEAQESLEAMRLDYQNTLNLLESKRIEYQNTYWNASIENAQHGLLIQQQKMLNDYTTALMGIQNQSDALRLQTYQLQLEQEKFKVDTSLKSGKLGIDLFNTAANTALKMWGFGMSNKLWSQGGL